MVKKFLDHRFLKRKLFHNSMCLLANLDKRIPNSFRPSFHFFENLAMVGDLAAILDFPLFARRPWRILPTNLTGDDRRGLLRTRLGQEYINADDIIIFFLILLVFPDTGTWKLLSPANGLLLLICHTLLVGNEPILHSSLSLSKIPKNNTEQPC